MTAHPVAAGKSSIGFVELERLFPLVLVDRPAVYLDLACGAGKYSLALAPRLAEGSLLHGLDLWEEGVTALRSEAARLGFPHVSADVADLTKPLPVPDASVDVCLIATVLHDLIPAGREAVLGELQRVLAPEGAVVVIEFKPLDHGPGPRREHRIAVADAEALFAPHGFVRDALADMGEYTYLARFVRG